jgi:hypothetical protein
MALSVFLVRTINPEGTTSAVTMYIASAVYDENQHVSWSSLEHTHTHTHTYTHTHAHTHTHTHARCQPYARKGGTTFNKSLCLSLFPSPSGLQQDDSSFQKFEGAVLNAIVFIAVIVCMTFGLVLLFHYKVRACSRTLSLRPSSLLFRNQS